MGSMRPDYSGRGPLAEMPASCTRWIATLPDLRCCAARQQHASKVRGRAPLRCSQLAGETLARRLRIWGSEVRILSGAPALFAVIDRKEKSEISAAYVSALLHLHAT